MGVFGSFWEFGRGLPFYCFALTQMPRRIRSDSANLLPSSVFLTCPQCFHPFTWEQPEPSDSVRFGGYRPSLCSCHSGGGAGGDRLHDVVTLSLSPHSPLPSRWHSALPASHTLCSPLRPAARNALTHPRRIPVLPSRPRAIPMRRTHRLLLQPTTPHSGSTTLLLEHCTRNSRLPHSQCHVLCCNPSLLCTIWHPAPPPPPMTTLPQDDHWVNSNTQNVQTRFEKFTLSTRQIFFPWFATFTWCCVWKGSHCAVLTLGFKSRRTLP